MTIHSSRLNANAHLIELLNGGVWLAEHYQRGKHREQFIEILLHPVGSSWVRWIRAIIHYSTITSALRRRVFNRLQRQGNKLEPDTVCGGATILERLRTQSSGVRIRVNQGLVLNIRQIKLGHIESAAHMIRACARALRHMTDCQQNGRLNVQVFLLSSYRDVQIGDLIASESLRRIPGAGGSLRRCGLSALYWCLVDAIYTVDYIHGRTWNSHVHEYVTISEPTYLEAIYHRALRHKGVRVLELYDYGGRPRIVSQGEEPQSPFVARPHGGESLSNLQQERVRQYLAERLLDGRQHLWYMNVGHNTSEHETVLDENGNGIAHVQERLTIVLFLHSFDDAQYCCGLDGFEDLYEWTVVSIDECLRNRQVSRVLIKEHPNIDPITYPGNKRSLEYLRSQYEHDPRVIFINRKTCLKALTLLTPLYGITHHGSVAEELVAEGVPVIASSKGPWGKNYPFLRVWDSPDEYAAILRGLTTTDWRAPVNVEMHALAQFVNEYRLKVLPGQDRPTSLQWMVWKNSGLNVFDRDISVKMERRIAELKPDSPELVDWLRDRAARYRGSENSTRVNQQT